MIKYIKQEDPFGCGIACVAMLAGEFVTYKMVRQVWLTQCNGDERRILSGNGLRVYEVQDLCHLFGIKTFPLIAPTIIQINSCNRNDCGHYIVITPNGEILDPTK
jgi:hypothetical protein